MVLEEAVTVSQTITDDLNLRKDSANINVSSVFGPIKISNFNTVSEVETGQNLIEKGNLYDLLF